MTTTVHTGEKMKNTSSQTWDKDRRVFISNMSALAAAYVIKYQHLWRALLESRIPLMLGPDTDLTTLGYYERLKELSGLLYENRAVDEAWSTVSQRRSVRQLRVFSDLNKFGRLLEFDFLAYQPYLLSLNDFLPESSLLRVEKKVADPDDLTLIRTALENMARVFSVVLGEKEDEYLACLKPVLDMLQLRAVLYIPTSFICFQISMGIALVMKELRFTLAPTSEPDKYRTPGVFRLLIRKAMVDAASRIPDTDFMTRSLNTFLTVTHDEIVWTDPKKGGGATGSGKGSGGSAGEKRTGADSGSSMSISAKRRLRRDNAEKKEQEVHKGGQGGTPQAGPCPGHVFSLLKVKDVNNRPLSCGYKGQVCSRGRHPQDLKQLTYSEAKGVVDYHAAPAIMQAALSALGDVEKANGFKA